ncbi:ABC transporter substrate-binding protein [Halocatena pleomorpha]|uniref:ABC transporter substrate-binding protein n=1 Tax=Halocatena pleomorpha TaxID=1785090 RepID=A0A3P3RB03_9EURY|nr:ABC transporter substrate-binding protein [Halocatena pleomorpha]RRJ30108.1 ABC transporter substrate-binding protein [Halocatena pleomorpha]
MTFQHRNAGGKERLCRREFMAAAGAASIAGFAGCLGGSGNDSEAFVYAFGRSPTEVQFNIFRQSNFAHSLQDQTHHYIAKGDVAGNVWPDLPKSLSTDGNTLVIKFPEDYSWWSGDDLTAEDYWTYLEIRRLQDPKTSHIKENVLVDDYTIERTFKGNVSSDLMRADLTDQTFGKLTTPRWIYKEYLERLQDATTQKERDGVFDDLRNMQIPIDQLSKEGLGNGPYKVVDWSDSDTAFELYEDHPLAEQTNVKQVRLISEIATENLRAMEVNNELDMYPEGLIGEVDRADYPDNLQNWKEIDWFRMQKITFNWKNKHLAKRPVRRAIAHALDLRPMVDAAVESGLVGKPPAVQTGIRSSIHEKFLGKGWADQLINYPIEADETGAVTQLEKAGYTRENGTVLDGDGNPVEFTFLTNDGQFQSSTGVVVSDQLESFGFGMDVTTVGSNDYYQRLEQYDHDMWWIWHVAAALWHPTSYFSNDFYGVEVGDPTSDAETGVTGIPFELKIPSEVGAKELGGDSVTIKPAQLMTDLPVASSTEEVKKMTRTLVQWFNFDLPNLTWIEERSGSWGDVEAYDFPSGDEKNVKLDMDRPGETALMHGWINRAE